jgi:hypothetical protein
MIYAIFQGISEKEQEESHRTLSSIRGWGLCSKRSVLSYCLIRSSLSCCRKGAMRMIISLACIRTFLCFARIYFLRNVEKKKITPSLFLPKRGGTTEISNIFGNSSNSRGV